MIVVLVGVGCWIGCKIWLVSLALGESQAWSPRRPFAAADIEMLAQHWTRARLPQALALACSAMVVTGTLLALFG